MTLNGLVDELVSNLDSEVFWVKMHSMLILGKAGAKQAVQKLLDGLESKNPSIRWYSALALSQIGSKEIPGLLKERIEKNPRNRETYQKALEAFDLGIKDRKSLAKVWSFNGGGLGKK